MCSEKHLGLNLVGAQVMALPSAAALAPPRASRSAGFLLFAILALPASAEEHHGKRHDKHRDDKPWATPSGDTCDLPTYPLVPGLAGAPALALLHARRRHDVALIAGTGLSAGRLTVEQAAALQQHTDVWALNQFFFHHDLVPDFYNLEVRSLGPKQVKGVTQQVSNEDFWKYFDLHRRPRYVETIFLTRDPSRDVYGSHGNVSRLLCRAAPTPKALVYYQLRHWFQDMDGCTKDRIAKLKILPVDPAIVQDFCASSLTRVVDLALKVEYPHVAFIGVDLNSPVHFYTALPRYAAIAANLSSSGFEHVAVTFAKERYGGQHATGARGVHHFLQRVARERCATVRFVNLAAESLLTQVDSISSVLPAEVIRAGSWPVHTALACQRTASAPSAGRHVEGGVRAVIYTVSTGGRDVDLSNEGWMPKHRAPSSWDPMPPEQYRAKMMARPGIDYIFFCGEASCSKLQETHPAGKTIFRFVPLSANTVRNTISCRRVCGMGLEQYLSRVVKLLPHCATLIDTYEVSIYVDANVQLVQPPVPLLDAFDPKHGSAPDLGFFDFPRTLRGEAEWILTYLNYTHQGQAWLKTHNASGEALIKAQAARYGEAFRTTLRGSAGSTSRIGYGKVIVRGRSSRTRHFNSIWWREFCDGVPRDQISYKFAMRTAEVEVGLQTELLNGGKGAAMCKCAADVKGFQAYFRHLGFGRKRNMGADSMKPR